MEALFWSEAKVIGILPIHAPWEGPKGRPVSVVDPDRFEYSGSLSRLPTTAAPNTVGRSFTIDAEVNLPREGVGGVIVTHGGRFGGYNLFMDRGAPVFCYNALGREQYVVRADRPLGAGVHHIRLQLRISKPVPGSGGTFTLTADGLQCGAIEAERAIATRNALREGFDIASDSLTPACNLYELEASARQGAVEKLVVTFSGDD